MVGIGSAKNVDQKGTTAKKDYQKALTAARKPGAPETVSVAMAELAEDMEQDVTAMCGPQGRHDSGRTAVRHGNPITGGDRHAPIV